MFLGGNMNTDESKLYKSALQNVNIMRCPHCLGCYVGIGCITKRTWYGKLKFKVSMTCGFCNLTIVNDEWHDSFEDALYDVHSTRIKLSVREHGIINYDGKGTFKEE